MTSPEPKILGLDPGLAATGYGLVAMSPGVFRFIAEGTFRTVKDPSLNKTDDARTRIDTIAVRLHELLDQTTPDLISVEAFVFFGAGSDRNKHSSSTSTPRVIGSIQEVARARAIPMVEISTQSIKKAVVGRAKGVSKNSVKRSVQLHLGLTPRSAHTGDALAAAIAGGARMRDLFRNGVNATVAK